MKLMMEVVQEVMMMMVVVVVVVVMMMRLMKMTMLTLWERIQLDVIYLASML
jgi:hypothetical protein